MRATYTVVLAGLALLPVDVARAVCTPTVQWTWAGDVESPGSPRTCVTPLVVQLTDDNGDSTIDVLDEPDVIFTHCDVFSVCEITAVDGATGAEHFTISSPGVLSGLGAGDIDGDGIVEILAIQAPFGTEVVAFEHTGALKWTSATLALGGGNLSAIQIADLDQDGSPEIYVGATVFSADGSFRWQGTEGQGGVGQVSNAVDVVPSIPGLEVLAGRTAYDESGAIVWNHLAIGDGWTAVADFDADGDPEIVLSALTAASVQELYLLDHLGVPLGAPFEVDTGGGPLSHPLIADLDADGSPEVVIVSRTEMLALDWTGSSFDVVWTQAINDMFGLTGAAAYDFNGDGAADVVYHDEHDWYVFDGRDGSVASKIPFASVTSIEIPVIANIDGDCKTEILITGCRAIGPNMNSVVAYECDSPVPARSIWNQYGYHGTNVNDDGTIPQVEQPSWQAQNSWLGQVEGPGVRGPVANAGDLHARGLVSRSAGRLHDVRHRDDHRRVDPGAYR